MRNKFPLILAFVCVCIGYACASVHVGMHECMCTCVWGKQRESKENYAIVVLVSFLMSHFYFYLFFGIGKLYMHPIGLEPTTLHSTRNYKGKRCQFSCSSLTMCLCFLVEYFFYLWLKAKHRTEMGKK